MTLNEFERLIKIAKKSGILKLKVNGVEVEFDPETLHKKARNKSISEVPSSPTYSDQDTLLWSTQGHVDG